MLRFDFVTLFPEMVLGALAHSMTKRASEKGACSFSATDPRDFASDARRTVDDTPFSGGPGMLMKPEPIDAALGFLLGGPGVPSVAVVLPDPTGAVFTQSAAAALAREERVVFLCGHYEGIDERVCAKWVSHRFSLGDYILTGGELPALVMADATIRLLPGVLGDERSLSIDTHSDGLLSAPQFTRPEVWEGVPVPEVLRSGDHEAVRRWKRAHALQTTRERRPDLFARAELAKGDLDLLEFGTAAERKLVAPQE